MDFILGSGSPRRREILAYFTLPFRQISPGFNEKSIIYHGDPKAYTEQISEGKARSLQEEYKNSIILTADTIVHKDGKVFTKPEDPEHAMAILKELSGSTHEVYTSLTITSGQVMKTKVEISHVTFHPLIEQQIQKYHTAFACDDKAGGYAIQQSGSIIVKKLEGCFYNVMGLPINTMVLLLKEVGIDLWDYLS